MEELQEGLAVDRSRHMMRYVYAVNRNAILQDFIARLAALEQSA